MGLAIGFAMGACISGFPSILGVWVVRLWRGTLDEDAIVANPIGIAVGISLVMVVCVVAAAPQAQSTYGQGIASLGLLALAMFSVGVFVGLAESRKKKK